MLTYSIDLTFINPNVITLTPNRRLAAFLLEYYKQQNISSGCTVWEQPAIYPLVSWIDKLWQDYFSIQISKSKKLLTAIEQQLIWEKIILNSKPGSLLLEVSSTAKQAINAWNMLLQWDLSLEVIVNPMDNSSDLAIFRAWAIAYQNMCDDEGWIDFYSMVNVLIKHIALANIELPDTCYLIEHQELSPQYCRLFNVLESIGVAIVKKELTQKACSDITVVPIASKEDEYKYVANWAHQVLQAEPAIRVGIIVHDLEHCRDNIENAFAKCFTEQNYNIAAPKMMANYPLIDMALLILQLSDNKVITMNDVSKLLRSPFIGKAETEIFKRAMFTTILRNSNEMALEYSHIARYFTTLSVEHIGKCTEFENIFLQWLEFLESLSGRHSTEYWIRKFKAVLELWGWPGERIIDANEQQLLVCWELLLQAYQQLEFIVKEHDFKEACKVLQKLAFSTPFLPETGQVSIHVLGVLEAAGLPFDKLWVMRMHSSAWPMASQPNPFLPVSIQRQFNLPRSSPARELEVARRLTATFCRSGFKQVIFSFPKIVDDIPMTVSRLLAQFPFAVGCSWLRGNEGLSVVIPAEAGIQYNDLDSCTRYAGAAGPSFRKDLRGVRGNDNKQCGNNMEEIIDDNGGEYLTTTIVPGGSKTLKLQANCPFWAFAEIRLKAFPMVKATIGLTPAERGELLHGAIAQFWQKVKTHEYLLKISAQDINASILLYITEGLQSLQKKRPLTLTKNYIALETDRMVNLMSKWILKEKQRVPFAVYKLEQQQLCRIGELNFKIRIDRIDQLTTGEIVIIDYKTGKVQIKEWFGERLQDPQLPLYCLATDLTPASIAFAIIRPDSALFKGIAKSSGLLPGVFGFQDLANSNKALTWHEQRLVWQQQLAILANEFQQGVATVQPLFGSITCRSCNLQALCRVHEKVEEPCNVCT